MITLTRREWSMPAPALLLIIPPLVIFGASGFFTFMHGAPSGYFPQPWLQNGAAEAAGRTKAIAAFLLCAGMEIAVLVIWASNFRMFDRQSAIRVLIVYLLTVGAGTAAVVAFKAFDGAPYLDQEFACDSFQRLSAPQSISSPQQQAAHVVIQISSSPRSDAQQGTPLRPVGTNAARATGAMPPHHGDAGQEVRPAPSAPTELARGCSAPQFFTLHLMICILGGLLTLGMPAVIFGAITCLAAPTTGSKEERLAAWSSQARRLNNFLYLAAAYMISGLLFSNAQLSWIGFSLPPDDLGPYRAYVGAIVLHGGISNSLIIASYYLPVAIWLNAAKPPRPASTAARTKEKGVETPDPFAPLKIAGSILAPALVGFLGEFLKI
jgi:hypothetical protein